MSRIKVIFESSEYACEIESSRSHAEHRNRLLAAISVAGTDGFYATQDALIELLRELEATKDPALEIS